jgi:hypothetical protein
MRWIGDGRRARKPASARTPDRPARFGAKQPASYSQKKKKQPGRRTAGSEERRATVLVWCHESHDGMAWNEDRKVLKARWQCMNEW